RRVWQFLEQAHHVITGDAHQSAGKGQSRHGRPWLRSQFEGRSQTTEVFILVCRKWMAGVVYVKRVPFQPYLDAIPEAQERIPGQPLATLDTFQQEPRLQFLQLQVCRNRGVEVGSYVERGLHARCNFPEKGFVVAKKNPPPLSAEMGFVFF